MTCIKFRFFFYYFQFGIRSTVENQIVDLAAHAIMYLIQSLAEDAVFFFLFFPIALIKLINTFVYGDQQSTAVGCGLGFMFSFFFFFSFKS